jgi:3-deoxy-D-manno-octulosonic-acid transferase
VTQEQRELASRLRSELNDLAECCLILSSEHADEESIAHARNTLKQYRDNHHHALVIGRGQIDELLEDGQ